MSPLNPRVQRDELKSYVGKKVTIGTRSYHYLSGRFERIRAETDQIEMSIHGELWLVPLVEVATIQEAPASQAEYVK
jgi:hypothetical protein